MVLFAPYCFSSTMRLTSVIVYGALALLTGVSGFERGDGHALKIPLTEITPGEAVEQSLLGRRQTVGNSPNEKYLKNILYLVELRIGTPPQTIRAVSDAGSSDLVVETSSSDVYPKIRARILDHVSILPFNHDTPWALICYRSGELFIYRRIHLGIVLDAAEYEVFVFMPPISSLRHRASSISMQEKSCLAPWMQ